jgi:hypothetical protein
LGDRSRRIARLVSSDRIRAGPPLRHLAGDDRRWRDAPSTAVVSFRVDALEEEVARLAGLDIEPRDEMTDSGTARFITYLDPDGNEIQLLER